MLTELSWWLRRLFGQKRTTRRHWRSSLEQLEERLAPAGNLLITTAGPNFNSILQQYTPAGALVQTVTIPLVAGSPIDDNAAGSLAQNASGHVLVYTGVFDAALASYNPTTGVWSQQTYPDWNHAAVSGAGGLGVYQNYVYAGDMQIGNDPTQTNGVVRFNLSNGTAARFNSYNTDINTLTVGLDNMLYGLGGIGGASVYVIEPNTMNLLSTVALPFLDYRGIAVDAAGDIFTAVFGNTIDEFNPAGVLLNSVTVPANVGNVMSIAIAPNGTSLAVGTHSGFVVQMTSALTNVTSFNTGSGSDVYVAFAAAPAGPTNPVSVSIADASQLEPAAGGTVNMNFTVTRTGNLTLPLTVGYTTVAGTAQPGANYTPETGTKTFAVGSATATISIPILGYGVIPSPSLTFSVQLTGVVGAPITLASPVTVATGTDVFATAVGDFNGDGKPDLAVVEQGTGNVSVLLNTTPAGATTPTFAAPVEFSAGTDLLGSLTVADFNGDGMPDLAVVDAGSGSVLVLLNTTTPGASIPSFANAVAFGVGTNPDGIASGDLTDDGKSDLVVTEDNLAGTVTVLLNTTPAGAAVPTFAAPVDFAVDSYPVAVAIGDLNGDGMPDLAVANQGSDTVSVLLNAMAAGAATPSFAAKQDFSTGIAPSAVAIGDLNGDGVPDLAVADQGNGIPGASGVSVLLNNTATGSAMAAFAASQNFATGDGPVALALGDLNGDGNADLVTANSSSDTISILQNTTLLGASTLSFVPHQDIGVGADAVSAAIGDLNGDGAPDLAIANRLSDNVSVLLNNTPGAAVSPTIVRAAAVGTIITILGPADMGQSTVTVTPAVVQPGGTAKVTLQARDINGNDEPNGGLTIVFGLGAGSSSGLFSAVTDNSNGTYTAIFTAATAGTARTITASIGGSPVTSALPTITVTQPTAGTVNDGTSEDINFQASTTTIAANWTGFSDTGAGIASYQWAIGTSPGAANVQAFINVGAATGATNSSVRLTSGTTYYVSVKATDFAGFVSSVVSSNGVTVKAGLVNSPPTITSLANQTILENTTSAPIAFTVGDAATAAGALVVQASSNNQSVIPNANLVLGGGSAAITAAAWANNTATITAANTFTAGQRVVIGGIVPASFNGTFTIASADASSFAYALTANPGEPGGTARITAASWAGNIAAITAANTFLVGQIVVISGMTPAGYDGTFTIATASSTRFTFALLANPGGSGTAFGAATLIGAPIGAATPTDRTLTITPVTTGVAVITLAVTDSNGNTTQTTFSVLGTIPAPLPFTDNFNGTSSAFVGPGWNTNAGLIGDDGSQAVATAANGAANDASLNAVAASDVGLQADVVVGAGAGQYAGLTARYGGVVPVAAATWTNGVATITAANTFKAGQAVTITGITPNGYNGMFAILTATSTQFTVALPANPGAPGGTTPITAASWDSTTDTATITAANTFTAGETVVIANVTPAGYDGAFTITAATPTNFTYALTSAPGGAGTAFGAATVTGVPLGAATDNIGDTSMYWAAIYSVGTGYQARIDKIVNGVLENLSIATVPSAVPAVPISAAIWSSGVATIAAANNFAIGETVVIAGMTPKAYNGTFKITGATPTNFTYALKANPGGSATVTGTASVTGVGTLFFDITGASLKLFYGPTGTTTPTLLTYAFNSSLTTGGVGFRISGSTTGATSLDNYAAAAIPTPSSQALPISDNFGTAGAFNQLSPQWVEVSGAFQDNTGQGAAIGQSTTNVATFSGVNNANVSVQATLTLKSGQNAGLVARYQGPTTPAQGPNANYYEARLDQLSSTQAVVYIYRNYAGTLGLIGSSARFASTPSVPVTLTFQADGPSLKVFVGATLRAYAEDSDFASGSVGMFGSAGAPINGFSASKIGAGQSLPFTDPLNTSTNPFAGQLNNANWIETAGNFAVTANGATGVAAVNLATLIGPNQSAANLALTIAFSAANQTAGLVALFSGAGDRNYYYASVTSTSVPGVVQVNLYKNINGIPTKLLATKRVSGFNGGLEFAVVGNTLTLSTDNVQQLQITDFSITGAGLLAIRTSAGVTVSNFSVS